MYPLDIAAGSPACNEAMTPKQCAELCCVEAYRALDVLAKEVVNAVARGGVSDEPIVTLALAVCRITRAVGATLDVCAQICTDHSAIISETTRVYIPASSGKNTSFQLSPPASTCVI